MTATDPAFGVFLALRRFVDANEELTAAVAAVTGMHRTDAAAVLELSGAAASGQALSSVELRRRLRLSPPATTALLDRLEGAGHVERRRDAADRRRVLLSLTAHGSEVVGRMLPVLAEALATVGARYRPEDLTVVAGYVGDLTAAIEAATTRLLAGG